MGMYKMRARSMRKRPDETRSNPPADAAADGPPGKTEPSESVKMERAGGSFQGRRRRFTRTNSTRRDSEESATPTGEPRQRARFLPPTPLRLNSHVQPFWKRRDESAVTSVPPDLPIGHRRARSNSAPTSPVTSLVPLATILSTEQLRASPAPTPPQHAVSPSSTKGDSFFPPVASAAPRTGSDPTSTATPRPAVAKRQATAPVHSRGGRGSKEPLTDTEVAPRMVRKRGRTLNPVMLGPSLNDTDQSDAAGSGGATPLGPHSVERSVYARRASTRMRLALPPPVSLHFRENWPHAGSWQDALYGYYDEDSEGGREGYRASKLRQSSKVSDKPGKRSSVGSSKVDTPDGQNGITPMPDAATPVEIAPSTPKTRTSPHRSKIRRHRRYRQALVPPTPAGLGFTAQERGEEPEAEAGFFDQVSAVKSHEPKDDAASPYFKGGDPVAPIDTRTTATATAPGSGRTSNENEKPGGGFVREPVRRHWWTRRTPSRMRRVATEETGSKALWRKRLRRVVFLDARVTIYIRLLNLAVVLACLGLAVTIRIDLDRLRLPGVLGPSTTINIAFSALTSLHVLLAIYREYFGRPIGLWALRSKMLWVCLDLLFVALWSSSVSLSTNDYAGTPLQCTKGSPWWRNGLGTEYAKLLDEIEMSYEGQEADFALASIKGSRDLGRLFSRAGAITSPEMIQHTLGIVLPDSILSDPLVHDVCHRQAGTIALSLVALLLYGGNNVLSLFRIFETIARTANVGRAVMV